MSPHPFLLPQCQALTDTQLDRFFNELVLELALAWSLLGRRVKLMEIGQRELEDLNGDRYSGACNAPELTDAQRGFASDHSGLDSGSSRFHA